jgi:hypothetical protein
MPGPGQARRFDGHPATSGLPGERTFHFAVLSRLLEIWI